MQFVSSQRLQHTTDTQLSSELAAMDPPDLLGVVKATLQQYDDILNENGRLRMEEARLFQENEGLRQAIEYGQHAMDQNDKRMTNATTECVRCIREPYRIRIECESLSVRYLLVDSLGSLTQSDPSQVDDGGTLDEGPKGDHTVGDLNISRSQDEDQYLTMLILAIQVSKGPQPTTSTNTEEATEIIQ